MLTFAKGVGNGITLAGVVARAEIMENVTALNFSTFGGNPLSAAAGLATFREVKGERYARQRPQHGKATQKWP